METIEERTKELTEFEPITHLVAKQSEAWREVGHLCPEHRHTTAWLITTRTLIPM